MSEIEMLPELPWKQVCEELEKISKETGISTVVLNRRFRYIMSSTFVGRRGGLAILKDELKEIK